LADERLVTLLRGAQQALFPPKLLDIYQTKLLAGSAVQPASRHYKSPMVGTILYYVPSPCHFKQYFSRQNNTTVSNS
jgi:hypothetical protein